MKTSSFFATLYLLIVACGQSQSTAIDWREAEVLFKGGIYAEAIPYYESAIVQNKANGNTFYKAGVCYLHSRSLTHLAVPCFEKAIELSTSFYTHGQAKLSDAPMDVYLLLGEACRQQFLPEKALKAFQDYKEKLTTNTPGETLSLQKIEDLIERTEYELSLKNHYALPANFQFPEFVINAKNECGEFSSAMTPDKNFFLYTIKVPIQNIRRTGDSRYYEDTQIIKQKQEKNSAGLKKKLPEYLPDTVVNAATVGLSGDGQSMLTYKNQNGSCQLHLQQLLANEWSRTKTIHRPTNPAGWEKGEYQTADGERLYFISNRPGGYGGYDLYYCKRLPNGTWSKALNLGPEINTEYDEVAPFPMPDGTRLYFSSNRLQSKKSFDVYLATVSEKGFSSAQLTGYPVNSADSNLYYQVASTKKTARQEEQLKLNKKVPRKKKKAKPSESDSLQLETEHWQNNYILTFENPDAGSLTLLRSAILGSLVKADSTGPGFALTDLSSGKMLQTYKSINPGSIEVLLPPEKQCGLNCSYGDYFSNSYLLETGRTEKTGKFGPLSLQAIKAGSTWELQTVQFNEETDQLKNFSAIELKRLSDFMKQRIGSKIKIVYALHSSDKKLRTLAKQRAEKVALYLKETGIEADRIQTKSTLIKTDNKKTLQKKESRLTGRLQIELVKLN